jgi:putative two-component system response regulator
MLLTAFPDYDVAAETLNAARVSRVLEKPCPRELLLATLREGLAEHRLRAEARARGRQREFACEVLGDFNRELEARLASARESAAQSASRSREADERAFTAARGGLAGLVRLAGRRNAAARIHAERVARFTRVLAEDWFAAGRPDPELGGHWTEAMETAAAVHDIGKVCVPDVILAKQGRLTPAERAVMQRHTEIGADVLRSMLASEIAFARLAVDIAESHHERWDGAGYPSRLAGEAIPFAARVVAVADCYDALTAPRPYRPALRHEVSVRTILDASGTQFDPEVAARFERCSGELERVLRELESRAEPLAPR